MRVAIVHYWLVNMRGGERVLEQLCELYPNADIFTLVCDPSKLSEKLLRHEIKTSFMDKIPGARKYYTKLLPLMPYALEELDLQEYDLVISSESGPAKGVITRPDALHICYCHSPMRYIWDHYHVYRRDLGLLGRMFMSMTAPSLRIWDVTTSARVSHFIANSAHVARRISKFYNRQADVIHPPVSVQNFQPAEKRDDFYLCAGQLVPYKKVDMAVRAFNETGRKLVVIGDGGQLSELKRIAKPNVQVLGYQPFGQLKDYLSRCRAFIFPGEEDFGILPVEAMASGAPVIAYDSGGALETVSSEEVGLRFAEQTEECLNTAIDRFEAMEKEGRFSTTRLRAHAEGFSEERFKAEVSAFIAEKLAASSVSDAPSKVVELSKAG